MFGSLYIQENTCVLLSWMCYDTTKPVITEWMLVSAFAVAHWFWPVQDEAHFVLLLPSYDVLWTHDHDGFWSTKLAVNCCAEWNVFLLRMCMHHSGISIKIKKKNTTYRLVSTTDMNDSLAQCPLDLYMWANKISTSGHKNWLQRLVFEHTLQTTCSHVILQLLSGSHAAL